MLYTNLKHIESATDYRKAISENENVMIICGRMGPASIPVYRSVESLLDEFRHVLFYDMEYDNPESEVVLKLPEVKAMDRLPLNIYYKLGKLVNATFGIQSREQIIEILEKEFKVLEKSQI